MSVHVRQADADDAELVAELVRRAFRTVAEKLSFRPADYPNHPSNCAAGWVAEEMAKGAQFFVAETDGQAVGSVSLAQRDDGALWIRRLAVLPEHRQAGHGGALTARAMQAARDLGASRVQIGTVAEQPEIRAWYERRGFTVTEIREFDHLPFTVAFMARDL